MDQHRKNIILKFIQHLKDSCINNVVDIGPGRGDISTILLNNNFKVTGIGLDFNQDIENLCRQHEEYSFIQQNVDNVFPKSEKLNEIDAIIASHIIEHLTDPIKFLKNCHNVLRENGKLCVIVPPFKHDVVSRHIFVGWNIGHLMKLLLMCGFNIKDGKYLRSGYNLCAIVTKWKMLDIANDDELLVTLRDKFPNSISQQINKNTRKDCNGFYSHFNGNIEKLNW